MRVFVTHNSEDLRAYYRRALPELEAMAEVRTNPIDRDLTTPELIEAATGCEVIVAHRSTPGEAALFAASTELVAFLRCAVDISTVDLDAANAHGVLVARADKSFVASTAELALGLLIDVARNISASVADYRRGAMPPQRAGFQLAGKTAGIIGYGAIGSYLAGLLGGLGMNVLVFDPYVSLCDVDHHGAVQVPGMITQVTFLELLAGSDVVFPLAPGEAATTNLIGSDELAAMKRGATLINVSRGQVLDEDAVAAALDSGQLGGLGLDVGSAPDERPIPALAGRPDVVATPHLGGLTPENADAQAASSVEQVRAMIAGLIPPRSVNADHASRLRRYWSS